MVASGQGSPVVARGQAFPVVLSGQAQLATVERLREITGLSMNRINLYNLSLQVLI